MKTATITISEDDFTSLSTLAIILRSMGKEKSNEVLDELAARMSIALWPKSMPTKEYMIELICRSAINEAMGIELLPPGTLDSQPTPPPQTGNN